MADEWRVLAARLVRRRAYLADQRNREKWKEDI